LQFAVEYTDHLVDITLTVRARFGQLPGNLQVGLGFQITQRQVFKLPLDLPDAQPVGERRINIMRLLRDPALPPGIQMLQGTHVVQTISQLDQHDAHILCHRQQQLAQALGLDMLAAAGVSLLLELADALHPGHAIDQPGDHRTEFRPDLLERDIGVLDHVMQHGGGDCFVIEFQFLQDLGDRQYMLEVGFTGSALLALM
jgi:hypothetical protein